jgi:hypothetical protein
MWMLITAIEGIRADRERALLAVAYDTMGRRSALVALDVEDFSFLSDGTGRVIIPVLEDRSGGRGERGVFVAGYGCVWGAIASRFDRANGQASRRICGNDT